MSGLLLDTNILSEVMRPQPDARVTGFLEQQTDAHLSVITIHELEYGLARLPDGKRRNELATMIAALLSRYETAILPVTPPQAQTAGRMRALREKDGRVLHIADALIGACAHINDLTLATRNVDDFAGLDVRLINPWDA